MGLVATGQMAYDQAHEVVRFTGHHAQLVGMADETLDMSFQQLEVAYLTARQIVLAKQGVNVQLQQAGGPSAPNDGHAPVPHVGSPLSLVG